MILLIDAGNTRLKWATLRGTTLGPTAAAAHRDVAPGDWQAALEGAGEPSRVLVANVAGAEFGRALNQWLRARWRVASEFVQSTGAACGLVNSYANPGALGVDRWLAMIGAWRAARASVVVVSAGTALTVDAVARDGRHMGGYIVPGVRLMREALYARTGDIERLAAGAPPSAAGAFGVNTAAAVELGARTALAALADRACLEMEHIAGRLPRGYLTGGDAGALQPLLRREFEFVPDLVLAGLAAYATEAGA